MTIDAGVRRGPSRLWYLVAALIPVAGLAVALVVPVLLRSGDVGDPLPLGRAVPVAFHSGRERMVWARDDGSAPPDVACGFGDDARLASTSSARLTVEPAEVSSGGSRWRGVLLLGAAPAGTYQVTCQAVGGATPTLSIGTPPRIVDAVGRALATLARAGLAVLGVMAGAVLALAVRVRRRPPPSPPATGP
jgi:hypothetical protein